MPAQGTLLEGRYRLLRALGSGGMGTVWAAEDERLGRTVAIKQLHTPSEDGGKRFLREAQLGAALRHPNLVPVFDVVQRHEDVLLIMEFIDGPTLAQLLEQRRLHPDEALRILSATADALDHAHAHKVVHRDVKPANILVGRDGRTRLADLGIASAAERTQITRTGSLLGTPAYVAPEQLDGEPTTKAADVYALATVAYEALCGQRAWTGRTPMEVMHRVRTDPPPDLREVRPDLPPAAGAAIARGMARDPAERPDSAGELVRELAAAFPDAEPAEPRPRRQVVTLPVRRRPRGGRRVAAALALAAVAAALVVLAITALGGDGEQRAANPSPTPTPTATQTATAEPRAAGDSPRSAVRAFYELAARDDFDGAWALAGPAMRAAFGDDVGQFRAELDSLESIDFARLEVVDRGADDVTVAVQTTARHTDRTDSCQGNLRAVRAGDGWQVEPAGVTCSSESGA